jgi:HlyD family secretion protein
MIYAKKNSLKINRLQKTWLTIMVVGVCFISGCNNHNNATFQGYVEGKYTYVSSAVSGHLQELYVEKGNVIKKSQLLFKLDPEPENSQLQMAKQNLAHDEQILEDSLKGGRETIIKAIEAKRAQIIAETDLNKKTLDRYQNLYKTRTIDKASLDDAVTTYQTSIEKLKEVDANLAEAKMGARENVIAAQKALVESDIAAVNKAEWTLTQKTVYAQPNESFVFDTLHEKGEFIPAGEAVIVLLPRETFKVIFFIPQHTLSQVHMDEKIHFTCDACHATYEANISFIAPDPEYTPPVIFSKETRDKLVYRIEAKIVPEAITKINVGQPVDVKIAVK